MILLESNLCAGMKSKWKFHYHCLFFSLLRFFFAVIQLIFTFYFSVSQDQKFAFKAKTEGCYFYSLKELCCSSSRA